MNISSAQPTFSITSSDTITIDTSSWNSFSSTDTVTLTGGGGSYTIGTGYSQTSSITIPDISITEFNINQEDWKDCFPEWERIQSMCNEYPGLKIAFEKFKLTYNLIKDDYDTPKDKRIKP
jgi:hypothetical protein